MAAHVAGIPFLKLEGGIGGSPSNHREGSLPKLSRKKLGSLYKFDLSHHRVRWTSLLALGPTGKGKGTRLFGRTGRVWRSFVTRGRQAGLDGKWHASASQQSKNFATIKTLSGFGSSGCSSDLSLAENEDIVPAKNATLSRPCSKDIDCQVEIVSWRERRITAGVSIAATLEVVWKVLTDYEKLAEFIPNLVRSERIPCPHPGRIWLLQQGMQQAMYWHIEARVVLDLQELPCTENGKELHFEMVDGDFKRYAGKWLLQPICGGSNTLLQYEVNVIPQLLLPTVFLERIIQADLPKNLLAIADRAEQEQSATCPLPDDASTTKEDGTFAEEVLLGDPRAAIEKARLGLGKGQDLESSSVPTHGAGLRKGGWAAREAGKVGEGGEVERGSGLPQALAGVDWGKLDVARFGGAGGSCRVDRVRRADEIHLRRLGDPLGKGGVHWRVAACITIQASTEQVWRVLTDYEHLPEFVPNLAASKVLKRDKNKVQLLQEGCKCLMYMVLHARVVLELREGPLEITFRQLEGDFDHFHGHWLLERLGARHTRLKYAVETRMRPETILAEAIVEEVIYEDLPANLCAIRDRVEAFREEDRAWPPAGTAFLLPSFRHSGATADMAGEFAVAHSTTAESATVPRSSSPPAPTRQLDSTGQEHSWEGVFESGGSRVSGRGGEQGSRSRRKRSPVAGLLTDWAVVKVELLRFIESHGEAGVMPRRPELRRGQRSDLEKAIARMGGYEEVAARLGLEMAYQRKPKHFWGNIDNVRAEVQQFQKESGGDPTLMPSRKSLERAGRYDLARALEKWGGLREVARLLGLRVRRQKNADFSLTDEGLSDEDTGTLRNSPTRLVNNVDRKRQTAPRKVKKATTKSGDSSNSSDANDMEHSPKPMKASVPASSKKWAKVWSKEGQRLDPKSP